MERRTPRRFQETAGARRPKKDKISLGCMGKTLNLEMPGAAVMNHSESVRVYTSCEPSSVSNVMLHA